MAIFEFSRLNYPRNHLRFIDLTIFEKPYVCVLNFWSKMVFVECYRHLHVDHTWCGKMDSIKTFSRVVFTKQRVVFLLSPCCASNLVHVVHWLGLTSWNVVIFFCEKIGFSELAISARSLKSSKTTRCFFETTLMINLDLSKLLN